MDDRKKLMINHNPKWEVAEAYRELRTNLNFLNPDISLNKLMITSGGSNEGKSLTAANLAYSMVQSGKEVIIIDADLHQPQQHKLYKLTNAKGLSNILSDEVSLKENLKETEEANLKVITSGTSPPAPAELLDSRKMEEVLRQAEAEADLVIIDTPPVNLVTDSVILANKVDGVLLVVAANQTEEKVLAKTKEKLAKVKANIVGAVLNKYPVGEGDDYYYYYGYGYNY